MIGKVIPENEVSKCLFKVANFINVCSREVDKNIAIDAGMKKYRETRLPSELFKEHDKNPSIIAEALVEKQIAALDVIFAGLGVVVSGAAIAATSAGTKIIDGVWDMASETIQGIAKNYLKERIEQAKKDLGQKKATIAKAQAAANAKQGGVTGLDDFKETFLAIDGVVEDAFKDFEQVIRKQATTSVAGKITKELEEQAAKVTGDAVKWGNLTKILGIFYSWTEGTVKPTLTFNPWNFSAEVVGLLVPRIVEAIMPHIKVPHAELWSGEDLAGLISGVSIAAVPADVVILRQALLTLPEPRKYTDQDQGWPEELPTKIGNMIGNEIVRTNVDRSNPNNHEYYVSLEIRGAEVWGMYNALSDQWRPAQIDYESYANWSEIDVTVNSITVNGVEHQGYWLRVYLKDISTHVVAFRARGQLWWGHLMDTPKTVPSASPGYQLGNMLARFFDNVAIEDMLEFRLV